MNPNISVIENVWQSGLAPDPLLTVSEWADEHRILSTKSSAEPGRWRTSRTPYLREIMDRLSQSSPVERVVFMKAAQIGATEAGNNWIGYTIHHSPGPMMSVSPTVEMAKRNSKQRIDSLIEDTPVLSKLVQPSRSRDSGNTILAKEFRGGVLIMTGANSAVGLRSMPVRYLFLDEVDGYPPDVDGEGDAISLAEARTRTFARRKIFVVSTPTVTGQSTIEREYEASDQRRYHVPCPHCLHMQPLQFEQLRWSKGHPETAVYHCIDCSLPISESHKTWMLENGEWRAKYPEASNKTAGYHLSSLYSPAGWRSWKDMAAAWEQATRGEFISVSAIKTFKNTELGETWSEVGESPEWHRLFDRREDYPMGVVPQGGLLLVAGVDVQRNRIEASVLAFGRGKESWLVEHTVLLGDTAGNEVWRDLSVLLAKTWPHASGCHMSILKVGLDTGYATQEAYAFCRTQQDPSIMPIKGVPSGSAMVSTPTAIEIARDGRKLKGGVKLYSVVGGIAKMELYNNLRKNKIVGEDGVTVTYPEGYVHLPMVDVELVQQMCSEQLVTKRRPNGFPIREWQKNRDRNEALDCYVYARAAANVLGMDRFEARHWNDMSKQFKVVVIDNQAIPTETTNLQPPAVQSKRRIIRSKWL